MKTIFTLLFLTAISAAAVGQNTPAQNPAPASQQNASQPNVSPEKQAQESSSRAQTQAAPTAPQQPISQQQVQAKTKAEYDAYVSADKAVSKEADLSKGEAAAEAFQTKFPQSQLTSILYDKLMKRYQQAENSTKSLEMARKELALDPKSVPALLTAASLLAGSAHETDVNFPQEYSETLNDAHSALQMLESGTFNPPGLTPEQMNSLKAIGYGAIGNIEFVRSGNDSATPAERAQADANAEEALRKATALETLDPDPAEWLRLAVTLDHQHKYAAALPAADKAVSLAADDPNVLALAQQEQTRLKDLAGAPAANTPH